jgi:hypothetical protein
MEDTANERNAILLLVANGMAPTEIASVLGTVDLGASNLIELVLCIHSTESALQIVAPTVSRRLA